MSTNPPNFINEVMAHQGSTELDVPADEQALVALGMLEADAVAMASDAPLIDARRIAVLACDGVDDAHVQAVRQALEEAGARVHIVSGRSGFLKSAAHAQIKVDHDWLDMPSVMFDAVYIPGGIDSVVALNADPDARHFVQEAYEHGKSLAASGEGVGLLRDLGVLLPQHEQDPASQGVVTAFQELKLEQFNERFIDAIVKDRHWRRTEDSASPLH